MLFKTVLVPVSEDLRERSEEALKALRELQPEKTVLLHVLPPVPLAIAGKDRESIGKEEEAEAAKAVFAGFEEVPHKRMIRHGEPATVITKTAEEIGADLILMVSTGQDNLGEMLAGSTAERVLRNTRIMLLVIKKTA